MGSLLSTTRSAQLQARLDAKIAQLAVANATYLTLLGRNNEEYRLDTEDGTMAKARIQNLNKLKNQINELERDIDSLQQRIDGAGVVNMTLRRN